METLFTLDEKNYRDDMPIYERFAVRAIICRNGKYAMQKSKAGDYKIPGGGIEPGETHMQALEREVREETGLLIIPDSIQEIGETLERRIDKYNTSQIFVAHSYFYYCNVEEKSVEPTMTESEIRLGYQPVWENLETIIRVNELFLKDYWQKRDHLFLKWLYGQKKVDNPQK
ncbi:MAG: NUDIX domain-containing protein [Lachnospiraceae bacterium]|nr:NUDIX domain-containing protein [Lachnospiraceae bacterium]